MRINQHPAAKIRRAAVAGMFYPQDPAELRDTIHSCFMNAPAGVAVASPPKALIVPHAGYMYSGTVAASAYATIGEMRQRIRRVVILGPSHRVYLRGIAVPHVDAFATPLGQIQIDAAGKAQLLAHADVIAADEPHAQEHALEVQLPFLQTMLGEFTLLPLVAGVASAAQVGSVLAEVWGDEHTLVLISTDLSHYHTYARARQLDARTATAIVERRFDLTGEDACGAIAVNGLTYLAGTRDYRITEVSRLNSGDTGGDHNRVVGYGAFALHATHA